MDFTFISEFNLSEITEENKSPVIKKKEVQKYRNPIEIALRMEKIINEGNITRAELARRVGISDVRVTQYMNLLKLPPRIKKKILQKGEAIGISERKLRSLIGNNK